MCSKRHGICLKIHVLYQSLYSQHKCKQGNFIPPYDCAACHTFGFFTDFLGELQEKQIKHLFVYHRVKQKRSSVSFEFMNSGQNKIIVITQKLCVWKSKCYNITPQHSYTLNAPKKFKFADWQFWRNADDILVFSTKKKQDGNSNRKTRQLCTDKRYICKIIIQIT